MARPVPPQPLRCLMLAGRAPEVRWSSSTRKGFSRLELLVVIVVISILAGTLLERLYHYQEVAEKARMEYTITRIKSHLRLRMASLLVAGRAQDYASLANDNPMNWLEDKPENYQGEIASAINEPLEPGKWYFDKSSRVLIYLVRRGEHFRSASAGRKAVQLKIVSIPNRLEDTNGGSVDGPADSIAVELVEQYQWL